MWTSELNLKEVPENVFMFLSYRWGIWEELFGLPVIDMITPLHMNIIDLLSLCRPLFWMPSRLPSKYMSLTPMDFWACLNTSL